MVKCKVCIYIGASTEELKAHVLIMHSDPCFKCDNCNYTGVSTVEVKNHMLVMHCESVIGKSHNIEEATPSVELRRDKTKFTFCDYKDMDENDLKRHIRDEHNESKSPSTSPPKKKTRQESYAVVEDIIEGLTNSLNLEDKMEEDEKEEENLKDSDVEKEELAKRSRLQDEKVLAKQTKIEESEKLLLEQQRITRCKEFEEKKRKREEKSKHSLKDICKKGGTQDAKNRIPEKYRIFSK